MHRCRWMVVRVPWMERQNLNVRMQSMRHSSEMASPILVTSQSPKVCWERKDCFLHVFSVKLEVLFSKNQGVLPTAVL